MFGPKCWNDHLTRNHFRVGRIWIVVGINCNSQMPVLRERHWRPTLSRIVKAHDRTQEYVHHAVNHSNLYMSFRPEHCAPYRLVVKREGNRVLACVVWNALRVG